MSFGENLNNVIKAKRYSIREVSDATGIAYSTLVEWLNGRSPYVSSDLLKLSRFLSVSIEFLISGIETSQDIVNEVLAKKEIRTGKYLLTIEEIKE